jgi:hypothetical protein
MAIAMVFDTPGGTQEQYDQIAAQLRQRGVRLPVAGQLLHLAGPVDGGWRTVDVWESREAADRFFQEHLAAAFAAAGRGGDVQSQSFPVHALAK